MKKFDKMYYRKIEVKHIREEYRMSHRDYYKYIKSRKLEEKRLKFWTFLINRAYDNGCSIREYSRRFDIPKSVLYRIKKEFNIETKLFNKTNKRITDEIKSKMIDDYTVHGLSCAKISKKYGFKTSKTTLDVLEDFHIKRKTMSDYTDYNVSFFRKIDTHDKSYILGFLLADGYVLKDYVGIGIQLTEKDGYLLEKIGKMLGESSSVIKIKGKGKHKILDKFVYCRGMNRLTCHCPTMCEDLKKYGFVKNKTKILKFPDIENRLYPSFFRGYIDGDGTLGINKSNNYPWCKFVSASEDFVYPAKNKIDSFGFKTAVYFKKSGIFELYVCGGRHVIQKFLKWIYKYKNDLYLRRKYEKMQGEIC